jgi:NAD+ synthase (glutamine-hydrolysing)
MNNSALIKVASAIPQVEVANCKFNVEHIEALIKQAAEQQVKIVCFPELCITAYTCGDLFRQELLLDEAGKALLQLVNNTADLPIISIVGMPMRLGKGLCNVALVFEKGKVLGIVPKINLQYEEKRWFSSETAQCYCEQSKHHYPVIVGFDPQSSTFGTNQLFTLGNINFAVAIGENFSKVPQNADIIFNPSAIEELAGSNKRLKKRIEEHQTNFVYSSAGFGESTTDLVFAGNAYIAENGKIIAASERFSFEEQLIIAEIATPQPPKVGVVKSTPTEVSVLKSPLGEPAVVTYKEQLVGVEGWRSFIPSDNDMDERCSEIFNIQISGLATRIKHTCAKTIVIGVSGGLDSTLALLVCVKTFDKLKIPRNQIIGITMPGFGTTDQTYNNAVELMKQLGVTVREISIKDACIQHFKDINHDPDLHNYVYENVQARERTQILMDIANQTNGLVVGTGDLSELALGWTTYNGDQMSMYGVNAGIPKTLISCMVKWASNLENESVRKILLDVVETPVSPELLPAKDGKISQKTEDLVGPYELHDFFIYYTIRHGFSPAKIFSLATQAFENKYDHETIKQWLKVFFRRFFNQQFKRSCLPDGPKIGSVCLSPRGSWAMPSDASSEMWLKEIDKIY